MSLGRYTYAKVSATNPSAIACAEEYLTRLGEVLQQIPHEQVDEIRDVLLRAYEKDRRIFLFGNGGSASLASHFACDLGKGVTMGSNGRKRFRAIALTDNIPMITAWANDSHYEDVFAEQLKNLIEAEDVAFAISASGNSRNVLKALELARRAGAFCVGLGGYDGGKMKPLCDLCLLVPSDNMQLIEDLHLSITHALFGTIRYKLQTRVQSTALKLTTAAG
jgi:D-sedoheptulose 7-phosphate isomerase